MWEHFLWDTEVSLEDRFHCIPNIDSDDIRLKCMFLCVSAKHLHGLK